MSTNKNIEKFLNCQIRIVNTKTNWSLTSHDYPHVNYCCEDRRDNKSFYVISHLDGWDGKIWQIEPTDGPYYRIKHPAKNQAPNWFAKNQYLAVENSHTTDKLLGQPTSLKVHIE